MILRFQALAVLLSVISATNGLQASDIPADTPVASLISTAKSYLANGSPRDALVYFDAAIARDPANYLTIFQRGAAHLSLGKTSKASEDFDRALELKPDFEGALIQRARLRTRNADWAGARRDFEAAGKKGSTEFAELEEAQKAAVDADKAEKKGDWEACVSHAGTAILKASTSLALRQLRARCRFERGEVQEGVNDLAHVLNIAPGLVEPHLQMSAMLFYSLEDFDRGIAQIRKCLHSDPDSKTCSRLFRREKKVLKGIQRVRELFEQRKFVKAVELLVGGKEESGLIADVKEDIASARSDGYIHPKAPGKLHATLVENACEAYRAMNSKRKAGPYCSEALTLNPTSLHGLLAKAESLLDADEFEAAIQTLNKAKEHHAGSQQIQSLLQKAHVLRKRSKQKDYYKVLGVDREADEQTIKRAYRKLTKQYHPDKASRQGISREEAEKKMAAINEAYEVLSDPELRARFDRGDDPNDPEGQARNPFHGSPFGAGGHPFFFQQAGGDFFQQGGGRQFKFTHRGFQFPGGFPFG
ncbi:hypothetical protein VTO42DRAFT_4322 [Malbranchea cinnamomea]